MSSTKLSRTHYDTSFKMRVVEEALLGELSISALSSKYSIPSATQIHKWIRTFAPEFKHDAMKNPVPESLESENARLKRTLQQKELELRKATMRADLSDKIIEVAEELYGLPIRKKVGTKL